MPSGKCATPLYLEPRSSPLLTGLIVGSHLIAVVALLLTTAVHGVGYLLSVSALIVNAAWSLNRHVGRRAIAGVLWDGEGGWHLRFKDGQLVDASLHGESFCSPLLVVLLFRFSPRGTRSLLLFHGSLPPDTLRRLRVRLRLERGKMNG